jgi:hypothetical protein
MFAALVGADAYPASSEFWTQLLDLPLTLHWPRGRVLQACHAFGERRPRSTSSSSSPAVALRSLSVSLVPIVSCFAGIDPWGEANADHVISACLPARAVVGRAPPRVYLVLSR